MKRAGRAVIFELSDMIGVQGCTTHVEGFGWGVDGTEVRAVPLPFGDGLLSRLRAAWEVICGRAYPVAWPAAGDLEMALAKGAQIRTSLPADTFRRLYRGPSAS